jgi:cytoskeletal protein RodZ
MQDNLVEQLMRSRRRWRGIAIAALSSLILVIAGWIFTAAVQWRQVREEFARAEQATQEAQRSVEAEEQAKRKAEEALSRAERALYASRIQMAEKEFADGIEKGKKP